MARCPDDTVFHAICFSVYSRGSFHLLPRELPPTSMEVTPSPWKLPTPMEAPNLHGSKFTSMESFTPWQ